MQRCLYAILILSLLIGAVGCSETEPTATVPLPAPTATEVAETATVALTIDGQPFTLAEVKALGTVEVEADGTTYTGVRILDLLEAVDAEAAGAAGAETLTLVASDGYSAEVAVADLGENSILALGADDTLDTVLPGQSKGGWVRDTVEIQVSGGGESESAEAILTVNGQPFTLDEAQALPQIEAEVEGTTYTGVPIMAWLEAAALPDDAATLIFSASDGYQAQVPLEELAPCTDCMVAFLEDGSLRIIMPGFPGKVQVRDLVEIQVLDAAETLPEAPAVNEEAVIANDGPVTVTDGAGRTVALEALPRRIVVVGRAPYMGLHLLYMFPEGRARLIGAESKGATPSDFLPFVDPDFVNIASMAANPGPEQIVALEPDLVLMKSVVMEQMGESLAQVGIPVVYLGLETPEQFFQDVTNLGALLGNPERAEEIIDFYRSRLDRIEGAIADVPEEDQPRVLLVEYSDRGGEVAVQVPAPPWMQTIQVQTAGGRPVWTDEIQVTDGWTVVNFEQIAAWDPDKIFVVIWYKLDLQAVIDGLKADPGWSQLTAVQNGELYAFPADIFGWDTPEPRWILGMTWLAQRMYPERFADVEMEEEIYAFFDALYGIDRAAVDAHIMPKVHLDVH